MKKIILFLLTFIPISVLAQGKNANKGLNHEPSQILLISVLLIVLYIIMLALKQYKILKLVTHKRILNILLLVSFVITTYSAVSHILWVENKINIGNIGNHVKWGIIMIWLSLFHFFERLWFFKPMLKLKNKNIESKDTIQN